MKIGTEIAVMALFVFILVAQGGFSTGTITSRSASNPIDGNGWNLEGCES
jgi:hypothetical protein